MNDDELITRLAGGDDTALRELFGRHAPLLAARLRAVLPATDVEDVLQETFLAAWRGAGSYRAEEKAGGWLWGIARRQAALLLRRRGPATAPLPRPGAGAASLGPLLRSARHHRLPARVRRRHPQPRRPPGVAAHVRRGPAGR